MKKWVCTVCGYVYEGENAPEKCPQCGVPASKFKEQASEGMTWACEHEAVSYTHLDVYKRQGKAGFIYGFCQGTSGF